MKLIFSQDKKKIAIQVANMDTGYITIIEKAIRQIYEFFTLGYISENDVKQALNKIISESNLKSNLNGYYSVFYYVKRLFPFYPIYSNFKLSDEIFLIREEHRHAFCFGRIPENINNDVINFSHFFICRYEAFKFLNFMYQI